MSKIICENFSENPKHRRGRPRLFVGQMTRNEQNLCYARLAHKVLSNFNDRFEWILQSKTLLTELGRIKDPAKMIEIADAISMQHRILPNGRSWPPAQELRRTVHAWRVGQSAGSYEGLKKELEALIQNYRERHPKLKKRDLMRALRYVLLYIRVGPQHGPTIGLTG